MSWPEWGRALTHWNGALATGLDALEAMHRAATGDGPGRRTGTEEFNGQLFVAFVGRFQEYARDLHDEARDHIASGGTDVHRLYAESAGLRRSLDRGNPNENALRNDFALLGLDMPGRIKERRHGERRLKALNAAISLRNGLAHGDASKIAAAAEQGATPTLASSGTTGGWLAALPWTCPTSSSTMSEP